MQKLVFKMNNIEQAMRLKSLGESPAFTELIESVRREQVAVFLKETSSIDDREKAHAVVCALDLIEGHIRRADSTLAVAKHNRGQDRNGD